MPRATFIEGGKEAGGGAEDANSKRNRVRDVSRDNSARAMKADDKWGDHQGAADHPHERDLKHRHATLTQDLCDDID